MILLIMVFTLLLSFPSYAVPVASPSEVEKVLEDNDISVNDEILNDNDISSAFDDRPDFYFEAMEDMNDDEVLKRILAEVVSISDSMGGSSTQSSG